MEEKFAREEAQRNLDSEEIAHEFHATYEHLAPRFGYKTRTDSAVPWAQVPEQNRRLMVAVVNDLLRRNVICPRWMGDESKVPDASAS